MKYQPEPTRAFLGVENSATGRRWVDRLDATAKNRALSIAQKTGLPEIIARILTGRNVGEEAAMDFLDPRLRSLMPDPSTMTAMDTAAARLAQAVERLEPVAVFGDYDVDGASSAALMHRFLSAHDVPCEIYIPDRIFEGYGPNVDAINGLIDNGANLIVTVDCGSSSFDALEAAAARGIDVVVLDHHQVGTDLPKARALVNPNRQDDLSGLGYLCAAGVVFMALVAVQRELRRRTGNREFGPDLLSLLDLVALATVCDVVPLTGLNRAFVVRGLEVMRYQANPGLTALARSARMDGPPRAYHLGFLLGPRINAGGRIGDASLGSRLLSLDDPVECEQIAGVLEGLNRERQVAEKDMLEEATAQAQAEIKGPSSPAILITSSSDWHPGIVGLLASRLKDRFSRPAIAIAFDRNNVGSGSARSVSGVDLGAAIRAAVEKNILLKGGGHAMAAGMTVNRDRLGELRYFLEEHLCDRVEKVSQNRDLKLDGALTSASCTHELVELIERAGPYGSGHSQPVFAFPQCAVEGIREVGQGHLSFRFASTGGPKIQAIAFRAVGSELGDILMKSGKTLHLAGTLNQDFWQGQARIQLRVTDIASAH